MFQQKTLLKTILFYLTSGLFLNPSYANNSYIATVNDGAIKLTLNGQEKLFKKGKKFDLNEDQSPVCFISGIGNLSIKSVNYKVKLSSGSASCAILLSKKDEGFFQRTINRFCWKFTCSYGNSGSRTSDFKSEGSIPGSKGSSQSTSSSKPILIKNEAYIILENEAWTLPLMLEIRNSNGKLEKSSANDTDSLFVVPTAYLKDGYSIKVFNTVFDDVYVNSKVSVLTTSE